MITAIVSHCLRNLRSIMVIILGMASIVASAYTPDYYTTKSQLAQGRWVKIKVSNSGIVQIDPQALRENGFNDPSKVTVYGYGGLRLTANSFDNNLPDDLQPTAIYHCSDGRIIFYAEADVSVSALTAKTIDIRRNYYDHNAYYFITETNNSGNAVSVLKEKPAAAPTDTHLSISFVEHETQNPGNGGAIFHDKQIKPGEISEYGLEILDFTPSSTSAIGTLIYNYGIYNNKSTSIEFEFPDELSISAIYHSPAGVQTQAVKLYANGKSSASITKAADGIHTFKFHLPKDAEPSYAAIDWVGVIYPRLNRMKGPWLDMNFLSAKQGDCISLADASASTLVWNITDAARIKPCNTYYDSSTSTVTATIEKTSNSSIVRLMAFDSEAAYPSVEFCGETANQNLHGTDVPEMVIITTPDLIEPAERLAQIHRDHDGLDVRVVDHFDILNEFSSGTRSAMAYRRYLKMLYDRDPQTLKYVLFYGTSWWDNRSDYAADKLICFEAENPDHSRDVTKNYTSDKYFVMLENNFNASRLHFGLMSVPVGRLSVANVGQADLVNSKIERYLTRGRGHDVYGNVLVLSDDGEDQGHFLDSERAVKSMATANNSLTFTRAHNLIYPWVDNAALAARKTITHALTSGQGMMLYCGHCSQVAFTAERLFDTNLISSVRYDDYPFAMLATCETFGFDQFNNLVGNAMINASNGGAIALIGSCRQVYMEYNRAFAIAVSKAYAEAKASTTIGEISMAAHNYCISNYSENDRAVNNLCYNLYGDPALKVCAPGNDIIIDDINGVQPSDDATVSVEALKPVKISGHIANSNFDGEAIIRIYDRPYNVETNERSKYEDQTVKYTITLDEKIIATQKTKVTGGRFETTVTIPEPTDGDLPCRLTVSAVSDDNTIGAKYAASCLDVVPTEISNDIDNSAPVITDFYLNDNSFCQGDILGADFEVYATIEQPATGLKLSTTFNDGISLKLDDRTTYALAAESITLNNDGTASLQMHISGITDGQHRLTLNVKSNAGSSSSKSLNFKVVNSDISSTLSIDEKTVRDELSVNLNHDFYNEPAARIIIEDNLGNTVHSATTDSFPYRWNLRDKNGNKVPDGKYIVYALLSNDLNYSYTDKVEFVVVK